MLSKFRNLSSKFVTKIFIVIFVGAFALFGVSSWKTPKDTVVSVDGKSVVTINEFLKAKRNIANSLLRSYKGIDLNSVNIDQLALNELIKTKLIGLELEKLGMVISDDIIIEYIKKNKFFYDKSGKFDKDLFKRVLASNNISESDYIKDLKVSIGAFLLTRHMADFDVPQQFANQFYSYDKQDRVVDLFVINSRGRDNIAISDKEIEALYSTNKVRFSDPEFRGIEYIAITPASVRSKVKLDQARIEQELNSLKPKSPEQQEELRKGIVNSKIEQKLFETIKEIEDDIGEGKTLKDLSAKFGLNYVRLPFIDASGLDVNGKSPASLPKSSKFLSEAFALTESVASDAIQSENGKEYYILNIVSVKPPVTKSLDQVKKQIVAELRMTKEKSESRKFASDLRQEILSSKIVSEKFKDKFSIESLRFSRPNVAQNINGLYVNNVIGLFNLAQGEYSEVFQLVDGRFAFAKLKSINSPRTSSQNVENFRKHISSIMDSVVLQDFTSYLHSQYKVEVFSENIPQ